MTDAKISRVIHKETGLEGIYENGAMHILVEPTDVHYILEEPTLPGIYKLNVFAEGITYGRKIDSGWLIIGHGQLLSWETIGSIVEYELTWMDK